MFKVLLYEPIHKVGTGLLEEKCELVYADSYEEDYLTELVRDVEGIIIRAKGAVTAGIIQAAPGLKVIGRHGVGLENIDQASAKKNGVIVVNTPKANSESVAEHFVGLALMLGKKIRPADQALRAGYWEARNEYIGTEMRGKTLGILGFGRIGQQTARICRNGFNMRVIYFDMVDCPETEAELGAVRVGLEEVAAQADYISVNLPLLPETTGIIDRDFLKLMKPTAFLINMARGPIWKESEVIEALEAKVIAGCGADVFETEPVSTDNPLLTMDNFVGTPHMSSHTEEAMIDMSLVARDILAVLEGREPEYPAPGFEYK